MLLNLHVEQLRQRIAFIEVAKEINYIKRANFKNDKEWIKAITEFVYGIEMLQPTISENIAKIRRVLRRECWGIMSKIENLTGNF